MAQVVPTLVSQYREHGWEKMIAGFEETEGEVPEWMKVRIRSTDVESLIGWAEGRPSWNWSAWDALPRIPMRTLFVVGELEDPDDTMAEAAAMMPHGTRFRIPGKGHIGAFLDSAAVLPHAQTFLASAAETA